MAACSEKIGSVEIDNKKYVNRNIFSGARTFSDVNCSLPSCQV